MAGISLPDVLDVIRMYDMKPHPEGGFFKETYRATGKIRREALTMGFTGDRSYSTAILYLLPAGSKSHLHRLASDELFHFYLGGPLTVVQISHRGEAELIQMGQDLKAGQKVQHVIPAGTWFGAYPNPKSPYSLIGCTVAPGFDFKDFEVADREKMLGKFPKAREIIEFLYG